MKTKHKITITVLFMIVFLLLAMSLHDNSINRKYIIAMNENYNKLQSEQFALEDNLTQTNIQLETLQNKVLSLENADSKLLKDLKESIHNQKIQPTPAIEPKVNTLPKINLLQQAVITSTVFANFLIQSVKLQVLGVATGL